MSRTSKPRPEGRGASLARIRYIKTKIPVHGAKRQRQGGLWRRIGAPSHAIPAEAAITQGYRLPIDPPTKKQAKGLEDLVAKRLRHRVVHDLLNQGVPPDVIATVLGVKERTGYNLAEEVRALPCRPDLLLVLEVLSGMWDGKFAGVLGTRRSALSHWLFGLIDYHDPEVCRRHGVVGLVVNMDLLRAVHAAFRLDYRDWKRRK